MKTNLKTFNFQLLFYVIVLRIVICIKLLRFWVVFAFIFFDKYKKDNCYKNYVTPSVSRDQR